MISLESLNFTGNKCGKSSYNISQEGHRGSQGDISSKKFKLTPNPNPLSVIICK